MSEPENFLSRWSRRKRESEQELDPAATEPGRSVRPRASGDPVPHDETGERAALDSRSRGNERTEDVDPDIRDSEPVPEKTEFDLSTLPSLDSIAAETDIRAFLQKGVPAELTRAALRRAWAADPNIRDFIGIAENQWDFATGSDLPGFGPLEASPEELRRMVADLFGEGPPATSATEAATERANSAQKVSESPQVPTVSDNPAEADRQEVAAATKDQPAPQDASTGSSASIVRRNEVDVAMQQVGVGEEYRHQPIRRPHGRALPQ
jgi:hypothetical protein